MKFTKKAWMIVLAVWLILTGLLPLVNRTFEGSGTLMALLAIVAGVLMLIDR